MIEEITQAIPNVIERLLNVLADKFGTTGEHLWGVLVKQQLVEAKAELVIGFLWLGLVLTCIGIMVVAYKKMCDDDDDDGEVVSVILFIGGFLIFIFLIFAGISFYESYMGFANPEFQALDEVLDVLKGGQ